ncbi:MAG TPA: hypothetical protein VHQ03_00970, partial [Candidatus Dormibacteraeota bacterium]|nr:hypothetical protein [Candidatus Dormibacteraeota bacterium]
LPGYQVAGGLFALVLVTWTAASLLSFSAVSVAVASREFQAGVCGLICSPNLAVMAIIGVVAACALASLG